MAATSDDFNATLAASLFSQLVHLAELSSLQIEVSQDDPEARAAKQEVGRQAALLRTSLATLSNQVLALPAGNMSLEDQEWMVEQLEGRLEVKRVELAALAMRIPHVDALNQMDTD